MPTCNGDSTSVPVNVAGSTTTVLVAGVAGKRVYVLGYVLMAGGTVNVTFKDGATPLTGAFPLTAQVGAVAPINHSYGIADAWFATSPGAALNLTTDSAQQVSGHVLYIQA